MVRLAAEEQDAPRLGQHDVGKKWSGVGRQLAGPVASPSAAVGCQPERWLPGTQRVGQRARVAPFR
jgi:hypothetical protein